MNVNTTLPKAKIGKIPAKWPNGELFAKTISLFLEKEKFLLKNVLNERTITHKLAEYLAFTFKEYDVDCEYNRMQNAQMSEEYITKTLDLRIDSVQSNDVEAKTVFPDIIVHRRGNNDSNHLVIEVKTKKYARTESREFDFKKLKAYTKQLRYDYGVYLEFNQESVSNLIFFKDGEKLYV